MADPTTIHNTFVIERRYPVAPRRVFAAFADPAQKRRWYGAERDAVEAFDMDFRPGGREQMRYRLGADTPFPGVAMVNEGAYADIEPDRRIVFTQTMSLGARRISAALITAEILPDEGGALLILTHQAAFFEGADGPARREAGWRGLLDKLAQALC